MHYNLRPENVIFVHNGRIISPQDKPEDLTLETTRTTNNNNNKKKNEDDDDNGSRDVILINVTVHIIVNIIDTQGEVQLQVKINQAKPLEILMKAYLNSM